MQAVGMALLAFAGLCAHPSLWAQSCPSGVHIEGVVTDPAGALIAGAQVEASPEERTTTDDNGRFTLACVPSKTKTVSVQANGFAAQSQAIPTAKAGVVRMSIGLAVVRSEATVEVKATADAMESEGGPGATELGSAQVRQLPDDPDDFLRQLQVLASAAGGDPAAMTVTVDGFQNGSALPPKSSIASIKVNPDLFSSENRWPPFGGGVIQIITKPGADSLHGAVFFTESDGSFNARDPFSVTATPASKQRYGFELAGPVVRGRSGISLALEKRAIDEFNVVNAVTLDASGNQAPLQQTVGAPQRLWIASARGDWQVTPKDVAMISYAANVNDLGNLGIGGLVLPEAGYASTVSEYDLRFGNTFTPNANLLHESRIGYSWKRTKQTPLSTAPQLEVAGFFEGGGATAQNLNNGEEDLEIDDNVMRTQGKHTVKVGEQALGFFVRDYDPDTFNGAFVFGGGSAPVLGTTGSPTGATTTIDGLEQYRRAMLNLPGGAPTTYQITTGTPVVPLTEWRLGLFVQDTVKLLPRVTLDAGIRYQLRFEPNSFDGFEPRAGIAWSPDAKARWVIHLRGGLFHNPALSDELPIEADRLNGFRQHETMVYSPNYRDPMTPTPESIAVSTLKKLAPTLTQQATFVGYLNVERILAHDWHARVNLFWAEDWNSVRIRNINAPMVSSQAGGTPDSAAALLAPRPFAPNENIFQYENSGHLAGNVVSFNLDQHSYKRFGLSFFYRHLNFKSNVIGQGLNSPQSSYSDKGESGRPDWHRENSFTLSGNLLLPYKLDLSTQMDGGEGGPYNITTGTDNNGDGNFNDRPSYAPAPGTGVYGTRFGLLNANTVNGDVSRNIGTMPGRIHLDMNLSRVFKLSPKNSDRDRSVTINARSANLLNHTNVTAVGTVVSAPSLGAPIAAEPARRAEIGVRLAF